ncbi:MAG: zinc ribbon domain-containing protein [Caldilineales bacterium]
MVFVIIVGALALIGIAVAAIALPLVREREDPEGVEIMEDLDTVADPLVELETQRDAVYQAIRELRFDFDVGKVSESDYNIFDTQLKAQAVAVLKEIDALQAAEADPELDALLEAEIAALRHVNGNGPPKPMQREPVPAGAASINFCPQCGTKVQAGDRFCGKCGSTLQ